jgi:hypothetical protein
LICHVPSQCTAIPLHKRHDICVRKRACRCLPLPDHSSGAVYESQLVLIIRSPIDFRKTPRNSRHRFL